MLTDATRGAWNMALDEAILISVANHQSRPTLRLYAWNPPCLSLGQAQPISDVDQYRLKERGWELVRRPTGGRAILHTDELTYSISAPVDEPRVAGTIMDSYRRLSQGLLAALDSIGLNARADQKYPMQDGIQPNGAVCFEVPSNYEITINGKKLIGSAQARRFGGILQHGSLPLYGDITRITQVLAYHDDSTRFIASQRLTAHAATVETALGVRLSWEQAADAFKSAFEHSLEIDLIAEEPSEEELQIAGELEETKYCADEWTCRV